MPPKDFKATAQGWIPKPYKECHYFLLKYLPKGVPLEWLVGIIYNECSLLNPKAARFEQSVYDSVQFVKKGGVSTAYPGFNSGRIKEYIKATNDISKLRALATSYGLGQLMGYHYFMKFGLKPEQFMNLTMENSIKYLCEFAALEHQRVVYPVYHGKDQTTGLIRDFPPYEQLLRIWNRGQRTGVTHSPTYVSNAMTVAQVYKEAYLTGGPSV